MALVTPVIAAMFIIMLLDNNADCSDAASPRNNDDGSSIPTIASGKRMHNIMRFGKRPAGGHSLIHFGKREYQKAPQHSFLSFGKRESDQNSLPDLFDYLQRNQDNSNKRGHAIMRFGKRSSDNDDFLGPADDQFGYIPVPPEMEEDKRNGHSMMYFGKRGGHNMMYFGKRAPGHSMLSFGKRDDDKRAHSMIHFGKREDDSSDPMSLDDKRGGHSMFHFGKREDDDEMYEDDIKRAHSMIHFGKRDFEDDTMPFYWNPAASETEQDGLYRYGKKTGKNNHAMIHFGKRDDDKRAHSMIHFGKRSVEDDDDVANNNKSESSPLNAVTRMKRDLEAVGNPDPLVALLRYGNNVDDEVVPEEDLANAINAQSTMYYPTRVLDPLAFNEERSIISIPPEYPPLLKKNSKNMFLRFG